MEDNEKEFTIIKIIITSITCIIATLILWLFGLVVVNAESNIYTLPVSHLYGIRRSGNNCYGTYNDIIVNCSGDLKGIYAEHWTSNTVMQPNHTYYFEVTAIVTNPILTGTPSVYHSIEYENNGWHTATADRNERVTIAPYNDGAATIVTWTFEIDSTIWTTSLNIGLGVNNAYFNRITEYNASIKDLTESTPGDNGAIIASIGKQTSELNQQSKENTTNINKTITEQASEIKGKLEGTKDIGNSKSNTTNSQMETTEATEEGYINGFKNQNVNYNINYNENSYNLLWYIINRIRALHESITILITSCLVILLVSQIFRRSKL